MTEIIIDEEFRCLLPALDEETFRLLEENILRHGCLDPLVLWNGILLDGYNRHKICVEHHIPFDTVDKEFGSREEALIWVISNQVSRRNLTQMQLSHFRGLHYKAARKIQGTNNQFTEKSEKVQNVPFHSGSTAKRLAGQYRVSTGTIKRDVKLAEAIDLIGGASPDAKRKILTGEVAVNKSKLEALSSASNEEIEAVAAEIEDGTYKRRTQRPPVQAKDGNGTESIMPEIRRLKIIVMDFANNFDSLLREQNGGGAAEIKTALRSHIDQLEGLYESLGTVKK